MMQSNSNSRLTLGLLSSVFALSFLLFLSGILNATVMDREVKNRSANAMGPDSNLYRGLVTTVERTPPEFGASTALSWFLVLIGFAGATASGSEIAYQVADKIAKKKEAEKDAIDFYLEQEKEESPEGYRWLCKIADERFDGDLRAAVKEQWKVGKIKNSILPDASIPDGIKALNLDNDTPTPIEIPQSAPLPQVVPSAVTPTYTPPKFEPRQIVVPQQAEIMKDEKWVGKQMAAQLTRLINGGKITFVKAITSPTFRRYFFDKPLKMAVGGFFRHVNDMDMFCKQKEIPEKYRPAQKVIFGTEDYFYIDVGRVDREFVYLEKYLLRTPPAGKPLFAMGVNIEDELVQYDLSIAGAQFVLIGAGPGGGKSEILRSGFYSLCYHMSPEDLQLVLIDTKSASFHVEPQWYPWLNTSFSFPVVADNLEGEWETICHPLGGRVATQIEDVKAVMDYATEVDRRRNDMITANGCKNREEFNEEFPRYKLPFFITLQDEAQMAEDAAIEVDLDFSPITVSANRARVGRSAGSPIVIAAQNPNADNMGSNFQAYFAIRVACKTADESKSGVILGSKTDGRAYHLLGLGDCLFKGLDGRCHRLQATLPIDKNIFPLLGVQKPEKQKPSAPALEEDEEDAEDFLEPDAPEEAESFEEVEETVEV